MHRIVVLVTVLGLALGLASPAFADSSIVHVVRAGENLFRIALRYGTTVNKLAAANGLGNASRIYAGQRLAIPANGQSASSPGVHIVLRGENLFRIALRHGTTARAIARANGIVNTNRVYAGQKLVIPGSSGTPSSPAQPPASSRTYTVRRGDTLSAIAVRFGVSIWTLAQANGIRNTSFVYVGQVLRIPSGGSPPPPSGGNSGRWIDVDLSAQRVTAYVGNTPVRSTLVSTGLPRTPTLTGRFRIYVKYRSTRMSGPGYNLPNVPYVMYYDRGYGLHGTYWHSNFGRPMSHGCINLPTSEAQWLFSWASVGTLVNIHD